MVFSNFPIVKVAQIDSDTYEFKLTYSDHEVIYEFDKLHVLSIFDALNSAGL